VTECLRSALQEVVRYFDKRAVGPVADVGERPEDCAMEGQAVVAVALAVVAAEGPFAL